VIILVVDDDPSVRTLLEVALGFDHEVLLATNGREGLEVLREADRVDAVLMDRMMPELDGVAALREIREDEALRGVPVVLLTAKATEADVEEGLAAGADAYVTKPFDPNDLEDLLVELVSSRA